MESGVLKTILLSILITLSVFTLEGFAQETIIVGKGGALYNWTAGATTREVNDITVFLIGNSSLVRNATGNNTFENWIRYKIGVLSPLDSVRSRTLEFERTDLFEDTVFYSYSILQPNGRWSVGDTGSWPDTISIWYLVSTEGDTLLSNTGDYLVTGE